MPVPKVESFSRFGLSDAIVRAVNEIGYETPSPIQAAAIGPLLDGRDILGQAQTGTGKTAAFALPLLSRLDVTRVHPQLLVLTPTRELAIQVAEAFQTYARYLTGFHVLPVYGGQSLSTQLRPLRRGVHVVVGTPGRVLDHLRRGTLALGGLNTVVLDEADEMLRMGFIEDVEHILQHAPTGKQLALFSATMPDAIRAIARRHMRDPLEVRIQSRTTTVSTVSQRYWQVTGVHKLDALTRILEVEDFDAMLIFVRTKTATTELSARLEARGLSSAPLNGDMNQATREQTVERLKSGRLDILVATDVAARGLDVERISHVINYDIPYDTEGYVHRIGRTARAGRKGEAILFVAPRERRMLRAIEKATGQAITPMTIPSREDVVDRRTERFKARISQVIEAQDLGPFESLIAGYQAEHDVGLGEIAAALAYMAEDGRQPRSGARKSLRKEQHAEAAGAAGPEATRRESLPGKDRENHQPRREDRARGAGGLPPPHRESVRYRIDVGASHGVEPKNIVGAIAKETGLESPHIGPIGIHEHFSTVDLPSGMPKSVFKHLRKVWVCGRRLKISPLAPAVGTPDAAKPGTGGAAARNPRRAGPKARPGSGVRTPKRKKKQRAGTSETHAAARDA